MQLCSASNDRNQEEWETMLALRTHNQAFSNRFYSLCINFMKKPEPILPKTSIPFICQ